VAPAYIEPGLAGDELSIEARQRHNMQKLFGFMHVVEKVLNNHADVVDGLDFGSRASKRAGREQSLEVKLTQSDIVKVAGIIEANDGKLKEDVAQGVQKLWGFLEANNVGISQL
jgi:hypothetical protein